MKKILVIAGPTAVGKTRYAIPLAQQLDGEIVSCDSMQVYRYMDIGSAKPTAEELQQVKHHLIGEIDPREDFSVAKYSVLAKAAIAEIHAKGKLPMVVGGSGLYLNALLYEMDFAAPPRTDGYRKELEQLAAEQGGQALLDRLTQKDPQTASRIHPNNIKKIIRALEAVETTGAGMKPFGAVKTPVKDYTPMLLCLTRDREELYQRINRRVDLLMEQGLVAEVRALLDMGLTADHISMRGIGYKELLPYFDGNCDLSVLCEKMKQNSRHYAKRQLTWFRRYDKMKWINLSRYETETSALEVMTQWVRQNR